ncbi:MAG: NUDIX hydrolase [Bacteroidales bacterium]|nr:NUDIX hydrolase [Bacteroidales bacterium]MBN2756679.1 NUDIX hydrolase [Bacteroidales bacterium]
MEKENKYCYKYPRPAVTTDCIIFGFDESDLKVLLIERGIEPFKGKWALPGGFVHMDETTEEGAKRELFEETGIKDVYIEQLFTFSDLERDPRGRVISVAYFSLVQLNKYEAKAGDDAKRAKWFSVKNGPSLAFDHEKILRMALYRLKGKIRYQPIGFELLSEKFTFTELQHLYEVILEMSIDKRNFRKKIQKMDLLIELDEKQENVAHKAAKYYKFNKTKYEELSLKGFNFEI